MKSRSLAFLLLALPCSGWSQATPTATSTVSPSGLNIPNIDGTFEYGISAAELIQHGYGGGLGGQTSISGNAAYSNKNDRYPLSLVYTGGIQIASQSSFSNTYFQSLAISQGYVARSWDFYLADVVSYLPQSPTLGLSGIPGTGDLGLTPVQTGLEPSQDILTISNSRVSNTISGNADKHVDAFTSVSAGASYGILRFLGRNVLDSTQIGGNAAINRRLSARSSATLSAAYTVFSYDSLGINASFHTRALNAGFQRQMSRALSLNASAGPEWISGSSVLDIQPRLTFTANAGLNYAVRVYNASVGYSRGVNGGAGVQPGGLTDSVVGTLQRPYGRDWSTSLDVGYSRTEGLSTTSTPVNLALLGLTSNGNYNSTYGGVQVSRRLTRALSAYASYNAISQSYSGVTASPYALNGIVQTFAIGVSYFPRSLHLGQF